MKTMLTIVALAALSACSTAPLQLRAAGGADFSYMRARLDIPDDKIKDTTTGHTIKGRLEVSQETEIEGLYAGIYVGGGITNYRAPIDSQHVAAGIVLREYLGGAVLRPFLEARVGYRRTWLQDDTSAGLGGGIDLGAALGLEYALGKGRTIFLQADYDFAGIHAGRDFRANLSGFGLMLGGSFSF